MEEFTHGLDACMSFLNHLSNMRPEAVIELAVSAEADGIELGERPPAAGATCSPLKR